MRDLQYQYRDKNAENPELGAFVHGELRAEIPPTDAPADIKRPSVQRMLPAPAKIAIGTSVVVTSSSAFSALAWTRSKWNIRMNTNSR